MISLVYIFLYRIDEICEIFGGNNWVKCTEPGKQEKEVCNFTGLETWSDKGWTPLHRVIRHPLAKHKKMFRILTDKGVVDVTDDHSLLTIEGQEIKPQCVNVGMELLHYRLPTFPMIENIDDVIKIFESLHNINIESFLCGKSNIILCDQHIVSYLYWYAKSKNKHIIEKNSF